MLKFDTAVSVADSGVHAGPGGHHGGESGQAQKGGHEDPHPQVPPSLYRDRIQLCLKKQFRARFRCKLFRN